MAVLPYKEKNLSKKKQVVMMFDNISNKYDFLNHFLSLGIDKIWRKKAINMLAGSNPEYILDIATGTGDLAIEALKLNPKKIIGVDISTGMLDIGRKKIIKKGLTDKIELKEGDAENLPFADNKFDAAIVSFGVRNFENLNLGLKDILRVLKPGGTLIVLEFSKPRLFPFKQIYNLYFKHILPLLGKFVSKDNAAYTYLPKSVMHFPDGSDFTSILEELGYENTTCKSLTFGISTIYQGKK